MNPKFLLAIAVTVAATGAYAQREGKSNRESSRVELPPILKKAMQAADDLRFAGTRIVEFVRGPQKNTHTEFVLRSGSMSRVTFPDESPFKGQVIVETKKQRRHYFPGKNEIFVSLPRREEAFTRLFSLLKKEKDFKVVVARGGEVADQPTQLVSLNDSRGNTIQRIWIDSNTGLMLKREMLDPTGTKVGGFTYTSVDYTPNFPSGAFQLERKGAKIVTPESFAKEIAKKSGITAKFIPSSTGYLLEYSRMLKIDGKDVLHISYQTGKSSVSFFQVKGQVDLSQLNRRSHDYKVYTWQADGYSFALIGSRDTSEFRRIAGSIR